MKLSKNAFILCISTLLFFSCGQTTNVKPVQIKRQFETVTLEVDISNKNLLAILLAEDGTINRKGSGIADTTDKNFFMGVTEKKVFDSLMGTVSDDLLYYCEHASPGCDTAKQTCKVTASFTEGSFDTGFQYCINGTLNDLPKPIKDYVMNAIRITERWYQTQKNSTENK